MSEMTTANAPGSVTERQPIVLGSGPVEKLLELYCAAEYRVISIFERRRAARQERVDAAFATLRTTVGLYDYVSRQGFTMGSGNDMFDASVYQRTGVDEGLDVVLLSRKPSQADAPESSIIGAKQTRILCNPDGPYFIEDGQCVTYGAAGICGKLEQAEHALREALTKSARLHPPTSAV